MLDILFSGRTQLVLPNKILKKKKIINKMGMYYCKRYILMKKKKGNFRPLSSKSYWSYFDINFGVLVDKLAWKKCQLNFQLTSRNSFTF